jgi:hypothetical protein
MSPNSNGHLFYCINYWPKTDESDWSSDSDWELNTDFGETLSTKVYLDS